MHLRLRALCGLLAATGIAEAQPAKTTAAKCAPTNRPIRWVVANRSATACFPSDDHHSEACYLIAPGTAPKPVATPAVQPPPKAAAELRDVNGAPSVCVGAKCTALGKAATAAVVAARAELPNLPFPSGNLTSADAMFAVTGDGKALVIEHGGSREAWSVARDKKLDLVPPKLPKRGEFGLMKIDVASGVMVATWEDCAGPCGLSTLVDSNGKNRGKWFGTGLPIGIDDKRIAIVPTDENAKFLVLDVASGTATASLAMGRDARDLDATRIDAGTLLMLETGTAKGGGGIWEFHFITVPVGQPAKLGPALLVPWCPP